MNELEKTIEAMKEALEKGYSVEIRINGEVAYYETKERN